MKSAPFAIGRSSASRTARAAPMGRSLRNTRRGPKRSVEELPRSLVRVIVDGEHTQPRVRLVREGEEAITQPGCGPGPDHDLSASTLGVAVPVDVMVAVAGEVIRVGAPRRCGSLAAVPGNIEAGISEGGVTAPLRDTASPRSALLRGTLPACGLARRGLLAGRASCRGRLASCGLATCRLASGRLLAGCLPSCGLCGLRSSSVLRSSGVPASGRPSSCGCGLPACGLPGCGLLGCGLPACRLPGGLFLAAVFRRAGLRAAVFFAAGRLRAVFACCHSRPPFLREFRRILRYDAIRLRRVVPVRSSRPTRRAQSARRGGARS